MQYKIFFPYAHQVVCASDDGTTKIVYGGESLNRTSLLASLDFPGSGKPGNPSYLVLLCLVSVEIVMNHMLPLNVCLLRRAVISSYICTFHCIKISCCWLNLISWEGISFTMESNIWRIKLCTRLIIREFCLMSGQEMVLSGHVWSKPAFLKMGCPVLNVFLIKYTVHRQQEIL